MTDTQPMNLKSIPQRISEGNRYVILLGVLTLLLLAAPFSHMLASAAATIMAILFSLVLLSSVFAVSDTRLTKCIGLLLALPTIAMAGTNLVAAGDKVAISYYLFGIAFLIYTITLVLRALFTAQRVTLNVVCSSLCVYIMLGLLWALVFSLADVIHPGSFLFVNAEVGDQSKMQFGTEQAILPIYYSFVTITTLGYGDIVPTTPQVRMFAAIEALTGQLYIAVLVARLVALHATTSFETNRDNDESLSGES